MAVFLAGDVAGEVVGELGIELARIVDFGDPLARVVGVGTGDYAIRCGVTRALTHDVGGDVAGSGVGVRRERVAIRIPHAVLAATLQAQVMLLLSGHGIALKGVGALGSRLEKVDRTKQALGFIDSVELHLYDDVVSVEILTCTIQVNRTLKVPRNKEGFVSCESLKTPSILEINDAQ